jgi:hypothetical protein
MVIEKYSSNYYLHLLHSIDYHMSSTIKFSEKNVNFSDTENRLNLFISTIRQTFRALYNPPKVTNPFFTQLESIIYLRRYTSLIYARTKKKNNNKYKKNHTSSPTIQ